MRKWIDLVEVFDSEFAGTSEQTDNRVVYQLPFSAELVILRGEGSDPDSWWCGVSGAKNASAKDGFVIWSAVVKKMAEFIQERDPNQLAFAAFDQGRMKLYSSMLQKFSSAINQLGYTFSQDDEHFVIEKTN